MKSRLLTTTPPSEQTDLIIYFAGWGSPPELVESWLRPPQCDLLLCWDYRDLTLTIDISAYTHVHVLAWSMGVWAAENSLPPMPLASATAVNGTPSLIHNNYGIPTAVFNGTLNSLQSNASIRTREKFERRMCGEHTRLQRYRQLPQRSTGDITIELATVAATVFAADTVQAPTIAWQTAIIGKQDAIFPPQNQQAYWQTHAPNCRIQTINAAHEALSHWANFSAILDGLNA